jgi:hypothetical protein
MKVHSFTHLIHETFNIQLHLALISALKNHNHFYNEYTKITFIRNKFYKQFTLSWKFYFPQMYKKLITHQITLNCMKLQDSNLNNSIILGQHNINFNEQASYNQQHSLFTTKSTVYREITISWQQTKSSYIHYTQYILIHTQKSQPYLLLLWICTIQCNSKMLAITNIRKTYQTH